MFFRAALSMTPTIDDSFHHQTTNYHLNFGVHNPLSSESNTLIRRAVLLPFRLWKVEMGCGTSCDKESDLQARKESDLQARQESVLGPTRKCYLSQTQHGKYHFRKGCYGSNIKISIGEISGRLPCKECTPPHPAISSIFPTSGKSKQWINVRGINLVSKNNIWTLNDVRVFPHIWVEPEYSNQVAIWIPDESSVTSYVIRAYRSGFVTEAMYQCL
jgi:hypothetical protein